MISEEELRQSAINLGVPLPYIEKDYIMGWLLWGVFSDPFLQKTLILKGGNCLRKIYYPDTRFSDDLDFTSLKLEDSSTLLARVNAMCKVVTESTGIPFTAQIKQKSTPQEGAEAVDLRIYFNGLAGDSSMSMKVKFDISEYEKIVLPVQKHPVIHPFSDSANCAIYADTYSLEEVLAEKLRSWIQRTRSRDLFDVVKIVESKTIPISKRQILRAFMEKTIFKNIPIAGKQEMLFENKFALVERSWIETIICPSNALIVAKSAIITFKEFINALFDEQNLQALGLQTGSMSGYRSPLASEMRELIIQAGKERKLLRFDYPPNGARDIEPYSFRYSNGKEHFYGFDRTRGQHIKRFSLDKILGISIMPEVFQPRWIVEF
jgi:predicted nucleotidyltransferase component of viral defense system